MIKDWEDEFHFIKTDEEIGKHSIITTYKHSFVRNKTVIKTVRQCDRLCYFIYKDRYSHRACRTVEKLIQILEKENLK